MDRAMKNMDQQSLELEWKALFSEVPRERMQACIDSCLSKLLHIEGHEGDELLLTLETFVACNGEINKLASTLFIHRNTVAYRIGKLEKLLGMPLKHPDSLLRLKLAFLFRQMLTDSSSKHGLIQ